MNLCSIKTAIKTVMPLSVREKVHTTKKALLEKVWFLSKVLLGRIVLSYFRDVPVGQWPGWLENIFDIRLPKGVVPREVPAPRGAASTTILLELVKNTKNINGDVAECGVFVGGAIIPIGFYLMQNNLNSKTVFGLDSFDGLGDAVNNDVGLGGEYRRSRLPAGFSQTSFEMVHNKIKYFRLESYIKLVKGYFQETLNTLRTNKFSFVHLDCELYESYKICLEFFYPRLCEGGIILLNEYNDPPWPGCNKAVDEFLVDKPECLEEIVRDNYIKYYIVKGGNCRS